ncbi:MAG: N-acyl-D-amino-acid deacylase family protein [Thermoproteota archaeon]
MYDVLLKSGIVVDGSGSEPFRADVGIEDGRIVEIGDLESSSAQRVLKIDGSIISPGFIDIHSHSDFVLPANPWSEGKLMQGVTTEVVGNCGMSAAPVNPERLELFRNYVSFLCEEGLRWDWIGFGEYLDRLQERGTAVNVVAMVGHNTIRAAVMGFEEREASPRELEQMKDLASKCMYEGAFGLSSGLIYVPGIYADTRELIELCRVVSAQGGMYSTHIRGEGVNLLDSIEESIRIGEEAKIPVQVSHLKASGRSSWGKVGEALKLIDEANRRGLDITFDAYPYIAGMTTMTTLLPPWALEGGVEALMRRLRDPQKRSKIIEEMRAGDKDLSKDLVCNDGKSIMVVQCRTERNRDLEGKTLLEASRLRGKDVVETVLEILEEESCEVSMIVFSMCEEDVRSALKHPKGMIGTDAINLSRGRPHPRAYGTYPRVLARYVREEKLFSLQDAVRKMTSMPAMKLGLKDRGFLRPGFFADLVVFRMDAIKDVASFEEPRRFPEGIEYVFVNGQIVVENGRFLRRLCGKVLRKAQRRFA